MLYLFDDVVTTARADVIRSSISSTNS